MLKVARTAKSVLLTPKGAQKLPQSRQAYQGMRSLLRWGRGGKEGQRDLTDLGKF